MNKQFDINTTTGVDLNLNIAGPGARCYAFFIDWHIRILLALALFMILNFAFVGSMALLDTEAENYRSYFFFVVILPAGVYALYHPVLEIAMRGRTPGKRIAGVRIVTQDAQFPGVLAILIRNVLRLVDSLPAAYVVGLITAMVTPQSVRIGDIAAGTVLIYDSDGRGDGELATEITPASVARHGIEAAVLGQELLNRWDELDEVRRIELGTRLLSRLAPDARAEPEAEALARQLRLALNDAAGATP